MKAKRTRCCLPLFLILFVLSGSYALAAAPETDGSPSSVSEVDALIRSMPDDWPQGPEITSPCAIVMDADSGTILYAKNATRQHYPASTTKIMTALLAIENGTLTDTVFFSNTAVNTLPPGSSHIAMKVGEELSLQDCLYGLLLPSANEVANALAEYTSGSIEAFVQQMNERAAQIGTVQSHFSNPTGLHDDTHYTCAYDLALIMRECMQNSTFRTIDSAATYIIPATNKTEQPRPIGSTHNMLRSGSEYYDSRVTGGKTGWTQESGRNLITCAYNGSLHLIVVTLGAETPYQYTDTEKLLDFAFESFSGCSPAGQDSAYGAQTGANLLNLPRTCLQLFTLDEDSRIVLPKGISFDALTSETVSGADGSTLVRYRYRGYPVGTAHLLNLDLSSVDTGTDDSLMPEDIRPLYHLNLWYVVLAAAALLLLVLIILQIRYSRRPKITFRKKRFRK